MYPLSYPDARRPNLGFHRLLQVLSFHCDLVAVERASLLFILVITSASFLLDILRVELYT